MSEFTPEGSFPPILTGALQLLERVVKDTKLGLPNEAEAALNYVKERLVLSDIPDEMRWKCPKCDEYMMMIFSKEAPSEKVPMYVWAAENKTSVALFSTEEGARSYASSFPASVGGGMTISKLAVLEAK